MTPPPAHADFWDNPDIVARFAARAPDHRLQAWVDACADPAHTRVLDVGCAAGRNAVLLARRGFDVHALDASPAMVAETSRRLAAFFDADAAAERVREGRMDDLSRFPDESFDLVISLGVLHGAQTWEEWQRAVDELARVLAPAGGLLLSQFTPDTDPAGVGPRPRVPGKPHVFEGLHGGHAVLVEPATLAAELAARGLVAEDAPAIATGRTEEGGQRVSVNAFYRKAAATETAAEP